MLYPYSLLDGGILWDASRDRDIQVQDVRVTGDHATATVAAGPGKGLVLSLLWIRSSLAYGPHFDIDYIATGCDSLKAWREHSARVEEFYAS